MDELIKFAASKFDCEQAVTSSIFTLASGVSSSLQYNIKTGFRLFMIKMGGYASTGDINVSFQDSRGVEEYSWSEYPDTYVASDFIPFLKKDYGGNIKFVFTNNGSVSSNIMWHIEGILISENRVNDFKELLYNLLEPKQFKINVTSPSAGGKGTLRMIASPSDSSGEIINEYEVFKE